MAGFQVQNGNKIHRMNTFFVKNSSEMYTTYLDDTMVDFFVVRKISNETSNIEQHNRYMAAALFN